MKKLFFILFLALLPACEIVDFISDIDEVYETVEEQYWEGKYIGKIENYDFPGSEEIPEFETIEDAQYYMQDNFEYEKDIDQFGQADYWQTPEEFYYNGKGDCEDWSLFAMYLLNRMNIQSQFILTKSRYNKISHAITYVPDIEKYIDFITGGKLNKKLAESHYIITNSIPYSEALWMTINYHDNVGKYR